MNRWKTSKTALYNLSYHLIWCPKYRRSVLSPEIQDRMLILLREKAAQLEVDIVEANILPDHVHLFVRLKPIHSPHFVIGQFKGYTSNVLRHEFSKLKSRLPTLWTRSYFVDSVGKLNEKTIRRYVRNQKNK